MRGKKSISVFVATVFAAIISFSYALNAQAANPFYNGTTMIVYGTAKDFTHEALLNSYIPLNGYNAVQVVYRDITGYSKQDVANAFMNDVANNPSATYFGGTVGHGEPVPGSDYITGPVSRTEVGQYFNNALEANGQTGWLFEDSCGSGATCSFYNPSGTDAIQGVFTSTQPGVVGNDTNFGNGWTSDYGEAIRGMLGNAGRPGPNNADVNGDGVITGQEAANYLEKVQPGKYKLQPGSEDKPMFFANKDIAAKYSSYTECIVLRPGQVDNSYTGSASSGNATVEFKPSSISGYGNRTKDPTTFPVLGQVRDTVTTQESELNFDLRKLGSDFVEQQVQKELNAPSKSTGITKKIVILPTAAQAQEFVSSLGGNANGQGSYTVGGMKVSAGKHYLANNPSPEDKIKFDNECNPSQYTPPTPVPSIPPAGNNNGNNNGGSGNPGGSGSGPTGGNMGGLESLLPLLLMQSLLGGQNGLGNHNGSNTGATNGGTSGTTSCASQGVFPVCGSDGVTYTNSCWLGRATGVSQVSTGVCASPSSSPAPRTTPDVAKGISQLTRSGVPQSILDSIIQRFSSIFQRTNGKAVIQ